ncbi:hypothetical protein [Hyperthermus butylicus]|nr:hypothetical protein [Hyperthermus butylicus]
MRVIGTNKYRALLFSIDGLFLNVYRSLRGHGGLKSFAELESCGTLRSI